MEIYVRKVSITLLCTLHERVANLLRAYPGWYFPGPVVETLDSAIHHVNRLNHYPEDRY